MHQLLYGLDVLDGLSKIGTESVQSIVTSPPYYGLRDYGVEGQIGAEQTPEEYVATIVTVFRELRRTLKKNGVAWLNIGDSYAGSGRGIGSAPDPKWDKARNDDNKVKQDWSLVNIPAKNLMLIPFRLALALQADGWIIRNDIIWNKPNKMPESVNDRCTLSHEYIFLLSKSPHYYFDGNAIAEPLASDPESWGRHSKKDTGLQAVNPRPMFGPERNGRDGTKFGNGETKNRRSVWTIPTTPYPEAHFATFPEDIPELCILASTKPGDTVLDPFSGSGTTVSVALRLGRNAIGIDLNPDYLPLAEKRILRTDQTIDIFRS